MAEVQQTQVLPAPFIQAAAETYLPQLAEAVGGIKGLDVSKLYGPQFVAGPSAGQLQSEQLATGLGGYQPYLQAAQAATGPQAYQQYMSPYQQQVIDTTLSQYDIQAQKGLPALAAQAVGAGAFGGGREGVQRAEYQTQSDLNRALLQAQLQQQGYGQAQQLAANQYTQQLGLGQAQQGFLGGQIAGLSTLGAQQQAQRQAELSAQQQLAYQQAYQPLQAAQIYGAGIQPLISGYPGQTQIQQTPSPTALQTALGVGSTLAGIYKAFNPAQTTFNFGRTIMSRILKRPMFRIGGSANEEGIMNMAVPKRAGYQEPTGAATTSDNYKIDPNDPLFKEAMRNAAIMSQFAGAGRSRDSRLSDLLIRGGLRTLSERPAGNIFATVGRAFTPAVDEYLKGEDTEESFQRQLRLAGLTSAMTAQENREKYKKELELAGQKLEQGEKELFLKTSGLGAKGYGVWETLTGLKKAGEKISFAGVDLVSDVP
jgi:hypothetical protein